MENTGLFNKEGKELTTAEIVVMMNNKLILLSEVNRIEMIDYKGRAYVNNDCAKTCMQLQDGGKTLKVFTFPKTPAPF